MMLVDITGCPAARYPRVIGSLTFKVEQHQGVCLDSVETKGPVPSLSYHASILASYLGLG